MTPMDPTDGQQPTEEELQSALEQADAAEAPDVAEQLANILSDRLDEATDDPKGDAP